MKILFVIESLHSGGKERQLVELLNYLTNKRDYKLMLVITKKEIQYENFKLLNIPYRIFERKWSKKDPVLFFKFIKICREFKPDIVHSWGAMVSFYSLPAKFVFKFKLINFDIQDAPIKSKPSYSFSNFILKTNFHFADYIISNSYAGLKSYHITNKNACVIYNGIDTKRFLNLTSPSIIKERHRISTSYSVVMVANYSQFKKNQLFVDVANFVLRIRNDVTFISLGGGNIELLEKVKSTIENKEKVLLLGKSNDVENIVNVCDIGVLFTNGEGVSNSIMEYMLLEKPVIAHAYGGTPELINQNANGYLLYNDNIEQIANSIIELIDNDEKRKIMGALGKKAIFENFTLEIMGKKFEDLYHKLLA